MKPMWGGRFSGELDDSVKRLNNSLPFDSRLWLEDIEASTAYAGALERAKVLTADECVQIVEALRAMAAELAKGTLAFPDDAEDIHSAIEQLLIQRVGIIGGKLHTGRSRNDQVATDMRLHLRSAMDAILGELKALQDTLLALAKRESETVLPGYTHMQHAQPMLLSHHLLAYFWMFQRDRERFGEARKRTNVLPLGSGALAGSTVKLDRKFLAETLGFEAISENSMDAVADRDYLVEFLSASSILAMHVSRFAEEIILWNSYEFGFIELSDTVTTGSSMMPQKKNPDVAELARGKTGRVYGHLVGLLTVLKGLPLTYNKDLQEDKEGVFDTIDTLMNLLPPFTIMMASATFNRERMANAAAKDFSLATDWADILVKAGMPFREAHELIGKIVADCIRKKITLDELSCNELKLYHAALANVPRGHEAILNSLSAREIEGGTGPDAVRAQLERASRCI